MAANKETPATRRPAAHPRAPGVDIRTGSIREARLAAGLSLAALAGDDLSRGAIHHLEAGRSRPSLATLELIAARTGRPVSFFLTSGSDLGPASLGVDPRVLDLEHLCDLRSFEEVVRRGRKLQQDLGDLRSLARVSLRMGIAALGLRQPGPARQHFQRGRDLFRDVSDPWTSAECQVWEAEAALMESDPRALELAQRAVEQCRALSPPALLAEVRALLLLGSMPAAVGDLDAATEALTRAHQLGGPAAGGDAASLAAWHDAVGAAHRELGNLGPATESRHRASALRALRGQWLLTARAHVELAAILASRGDRAAAIAEYRRALEQCECMGLHEARGPALLALAELHLQDGDPDAAETLTGAALQLGERCGPTTGGLARAMSGSIAAARRDGGAGEREFQAALDLLEAAGASDQLARTRTRFAEALEASGKTAEALAQWKRAAEHWRPATVPAHHV